MAGAIRLAQMKALAAAGMSESEYRDIQIAVYKSAWASEAESESGKLPAEAVSESMSEAAKQMEEAMRAGAEAARKQGVPGAGQISEKDARELQEGMTQLGETAGEALYVPKANVELFRGTRPTSRSTRCTGWLSSDSTDRTSPDRLPLVPSLPQAMVLACSERCRSWSRPCVRARPRRTCCRRPTTGTSTSSWTERSA